MKSVLASALLLILAQPAFASPRSVEGSAHEYLDDIGLPLPVERVEAAADRDADNGCSPEHAVRQSDYEIQKTRVDHGFRHGYEVTVTATYLCQ